MLYGTRSVQASNEGGDRDFDSSPIIGLADYLGAVTPNRAPGVITGGGGYSPAGGGGGGTPAPGETAVAGTRLSSFKPVDRNVSIPMFAAKGKARQSFQKSGRGARLSIGQLRFSPISKVSTAWGGLSGIENDLDILTWSPKEPEETSALGDFFSDLGKRIGSGQAFRPPSIVTRLVPAPIKKAIRYAGAGTAAVFAPVLTGAQQRKIFGLSPGESANFMKTQQASRIAIGVIATAGAGKLAYGAYAAKGSAVAAPGTILPPSAQVGFGTYAPAASKLSLSSTPAAPIFGGSEALIASPSAFGGAAGTAITTGAKTGGYLASTGKALVSGTGEVLKAVGIQAGAQALLNTMAPRGGFEQGSQVYADGGVYPETMVSGEPPMGGGGGGGGGEGPAPILAGASPIVGIGLALAGLALLTGKTKLRRK